MYYPLQSQAASTPVYCATSSDLDGMSALYLKDCKRCDESDLAKDFHLSFRIQDLTYDILRERVSPPEAGSARAADIPDQGKDALEDNLISNYSG